MRVPLDNAAFAQQLQSFEKTAFRLETQRAYTVDSERDILAAFLAGTPDPLTDYEGVRDWLDGIRRQTAEGKTVERVRIDDTPFTDYQRFLRWSERWTREAGEVIHHLPRGRAHEVGLLPAAGPGDWWLFDDQRLMVMTYNDEGRRTTAQLITEETAVQQARSWRDLAVRTARGDHR